MAEEALGSSDVGFSGYDPMEKDWVTPLTFPRHLAP